MSNALQKSCESCRILSESVDLGSQKQREIISVAMVIGLVYPFLYIILFFFCFLTMLLLHWEFVRYERDERTKKRKVIFKIEPITIFNRIRGA